MVNLSEAKAGDVVHFRCGGSWDIRCINLRDGRFDVLFSGAEWSDIYLKDGTSSTMPVKHPFDIVKVESK